MKISIEDFASVYEVSVYGTDETAYRVARVCTGNGFDSFPLTNDVLDRFVQNLLKRRHLRCFEFAGIVFGIRCPIFVERQLRTYRKPDLERSLRYCEPIELVEEGQLERCDDFHRECLEIYRERRKKGVPKEEARRVLPLETLTEVVSFYNLRSLFHVFDERLSSAAQSETSKVVAAMKEITRAFFPITISAYDSLRQVEDPKQ